MSDITLPPSSTTSGISAPAPAGSPPAPPAPPSPAPAPPAPPTAQDGAKVSPFLNAGGKDVDANRTVVEIGQLVYQPLPLSGKLARMTELYQGAAMALTRKGDDRALGSLRNDAADAVQDAVRGELNAIKGDAKLSSSERQARFKQVHEQLAGLPWLSGAARAAIESDLAFARAGI